MSHSEMAALLDTLTSLTDIPDDLDTVVSTNRFERAMELNSLVREAKSQIEPGLDATADELICWYEEQEDAEHDLVNIGWD